MNLGTGRNSRKPPRTSRRPSAPPSVQPSDEVVLLAFVRRPGKEIRLTRGTYEGHPRLSLREWLLDPASGVWSSTPRGANIRADELQPLRDMFDRLIGEIGR
jgi:hypothetical protein